MNRPKLTLPWEALNQLMAVYEGQVPPNPPVEHFREPDVPGSMASDAKGSIAADDLKRVVAVVTPLWHIPPMDSWALDEAKKALEAGSVE